MKYALFLLGLLTAALGLMLLVIAKSSIHEISAAVMMLMAAVFVSGAAVVHAIDRLRKEVQVARPAEPAR